MWLLKEILLKILVADIILYSGKDKLGAAAFLLWRCYPNCHQFTCYLKRRVIYNGKVVGFILYLFLKETYNLNCVLQAFFFLLLFFFSANVLLDCLDAIWDYGPFIFYMTVICRQLYLSSWSLTTASPKPLWNIK